MIDSRSFRQLMGCFATGITVVTVRGSDQEATGITINSLTSVSLEPPLVLFCLDKKAHFYPTFRKTEFFAVNMLSEDQEEISQHFADYRHYPKPKKMWDKPQKVGRQDNCPILRHTLGWMICKKTVTYKGGDHDIILGEVVKLHKRSGQANPLLYFHSRYRTINND
jgi:flavin reductase (DIM6/NTAB) family NADH-FMN oxidoreductase RutF